MRYFDLFDDMSVKGRWHLSEVTAAGEEVNWPLTDGRPYQGMTRVAVEVQYPGPPLDFTLTAFGVPVASKKLAAAVRAVAKGDVEGVPARIEGHSGFEVLNVVRTVDCLDEQRSRFTIWTDKDQPEKVGHYESVPRLRVDPKRISGDAHLFRLARWEVALVVSERLKEAMERAGCRGARFDLVSEDAPASAAGEAGPTDRVYQALFEAVAEETGPSNRIP